jgi:glucans biosynthesis protein
MKTHLVFAAMTVALLAFVISRTGSAQFSFDDVIAQARRLSSEPYERRATVDSDALRGADYDAVRKIKLRNEGMVWRDKGLPFQLGFFPTAGLHAQPLTVFAANREGAKWLRPSGDDFEFIDNEIPAEDQEKVDYAGVRVLYPMNEGDKLDEVATFLGASYFRAIAKEQVWGISARGIAVDPGGKGAEEFPDFTTFWFVEPTAAAGDLRFYALLDGPSLTGAYEFRVRPGAETKIDVRTVLFAREDIAVLGIAPLTSMYWYGENTSNTFGNFRPEVHDSDGLQVESSTGEWLWRPLAWSQQTQWNVFKDTATPRGFGLFQRDRHFEHYQDLEANYHQRPSVWVQPIGDWGAGEVKLLQLTTGDEFMDNVVAFWESAKPIRAGERREYDYTLVWFTENAGLPPLGSNRATRIDYQDQKYYRRVVLDFGGGELAGLKADAAVKPELWVSENGKMAEFGIQKNENDGTWRVSFVPATGQTDQPVEMRCTLTLDGRPLTETWNYTWVP